MALTEKLTITHIELTTEKRGIPKGFWEGRVTEIKHPEIKAIFVLPDRFEAARFTAEKALEIRAEKENPIYSLPSSAQGNDVLKEWVRLAKDRGISFHQAQFYQLDEYFPISADDKESFRKNLWDTFYTPLGIRPDQVHQIQADFGMDGIKVAADYEAELSQISVDLLIHPIGPDGHMGFNETGTPADSVTHLTQLSDKTVYRDHVIRGLNTPNEAITQGIDTILRANKILFIDFSQEYIPYMKDALYGEIGTHNPSSFLRTVGDKVEVIMPKNVADQVINTNN